MSQHPQRRKEEKLQQHHVHETHITSQNCCTRGPNRTRRAPIAEEGAIDSEACHSNLGNIPSSRAILNRNKHVSVNPGTLTWGGRAQFRNVGNRHSLPSIFMQYDKIAGTHPLLLSLSLSYVTTANFVKTSLELAPVFARPAHLTAVWSTSVSISFIGTIPRVYARKRCKGRTGEIRLASKRPTDHVIATTKRLAAVVSRTSPQTTKGNPQAKQGFFSKV